MNSNSKKASQPQHPSCLSSPKSPILWRQVFSSSFSSFYTAATNTAPHNFVFFLANSTTLVSLSWIIINPNIPPVCPLPGFQFCGVKCFPPPSLPSTSLLPQTLPHTVSKRLFNMNSNSTFWQRSCLSLYEMFASELIAHFVSCPRPAILHKWIYRKEQKHHKISQTLHYQFMKNIFSSNISP